MQRFHIVNGQLILPGGRIRSGGVLVEAGKIRGVHETPETFPDAVVIDAGGNFISPGFIDIHVHGGAGHDFMDGTEEAFLAITGLHARHGTTSLLATTLSGSREELLATLRAYEQASKKNDGGAALLGMHLEGPYFSMNQRGAQDPKYIRNPDPEEYNQILDAAPFVRRWSAAPELPGAIEFGRCLVSRGVIASLAHTDAIYEEAALAFENGYTLATHLYSAMSGVTRRNAFRYAGVIEAAFLLDGMDVEIIADGAHLPAPLLKLIYKIKGAERTALITDAMRAAGMPPGESTLGSLENGIKVIVEDGVAKLPDRSAFAGSVATADRLVRTMVEMAGLSLPEAARMITETPARILNLQDRKGTLQRGMDADLVIFDERINVHFSMVEGRVVHNRLLPAHGEK